MRQEGDMNKFIVLGHPQFWSDLRPRNYLTVICSVRVNFNEFLHLRKLKTEVIALKVLGAAI